jgi:proteasome lid subunit RPN8/RPN11
MTVSEISLPLSLTQQLLHHALAFPHQEVCGLIGAQNGSPCSVYPIENKAKNLQTEFLLDPPQQIAAFVAMREKQETLFAIYHSHPTAAAFPSVRDLALTSYPEALCLIISLNIKGVLELRGFKGRENQAQEVRLKLTP